MRVIAGAWRGLQLEAPKGRGVRPTTDRVKESMFNLIPHRLSGLVIDLFAGTGALGIEAMSRGASRAIFVEKDPRTAQLVRRNVERVGAASQAEVWVLDWSRAIRRLLDAGEVASYVFVDPPYQAKLWVPVLQALPAARVTGAVVCEVPASLPLPDEVGGFVLEKVRTYGDVSVRIYKGQSGVEI
ncbi:16S rRNA (guanine(966)-N(2))-methyltransferase RsmD [Alicyclobacillus vulcanalis]|uniref:16S rRNA (Guanine966-N2)-methyltransferase n=1 Tax=Alicyclobacillus vulcanalis TaxID=252246 RepID=A0A1N7NRR9_9BACL|nr:16S rRNA (guanine(966)-N(2))-methyltransferase RsmD [Alicyclobacillus vulcanalis]SIT01006.1 16S rRNA (guanine966-N2)-methyltransferase [Alicyclobacillus vulcanalis]